MNCSATTRRNLKPGCWTRLRRWWGQLRPRDVAGIAAREVARLQEEIVRLRQEQMDWQEVLMKAWVDATLRAERGVEHAP